MARLAPRRWLPLVTLGALGVGTLPALAQERERAEPVAFDAPAECPSAEAFVAKVAEHSGRGARVADASEAASARYRLRVTRAARGFHGTLTIVDEGGSRARAVDGGTCAEVVDALALVTAMALETSPEAAASDAGVGADGPPSAGSASASERTSASASTAPPAPAVSDDERPSPRGRDLSRAGAPPRWALGAALEVVGGDASTPRGGNVHVEVAGRDERGLAPALRLGLTELRATSDVAAGAKLTLGWTLLAIDGCAVHALASRWLLDACAAAQVGVVDASPSGVTNPQPRLRAWLALGGALRGRFEIGDGFYLEGRLGLTAPITRDRFRLADGTEAFRAASTNVTGGLGVGVRFP